mgnify:CR=1 FL=1
MGVKNNYSIQEINNAIQLAIQWNHDEHQRLANAYNEGREYTPEFRSYGHYLR